MREIAHCTGDLHTDISVTVDIEKQSENCNLLLEDKLWYRQHCE